MWSARDPGLPEEPFLTVERIVALSIGAGYVVGGYLLGGGEAAAKLFLGAGVANLLIWYPDLGSQTGHSTFGGPAITRPTPPSLTRLAGWGFLLLPALLAVFAWWYGRSAL